MFNEAQTDPYLLGYINAWGDVEAKIARDNEAQHPYEWKAYKTWRFVPDIGLLMWWETPDEGEKLTVEDWLDRKGYEVRMRSVMGHQVRVRENLHEGPMDIVVGSIGMQGEVRSEETRKTHTELGIQRGKCWRYNPINKIVYWAGDDSEHNQDDEFTVENHLLRKYGYVVKQQKNLEGGIGDDGFGDHRIAHGWMGENVKTLKGTVIKRFQNKVGKQVGPQLYVHRKYANEVIPTDALRFAAETLKKLKPGFKFNSVMWNRETGDIRFDEAPDFDTAREPHVGKYITISPNGTTKEGQSNSIWHHKWLWVKDDYKGFDIDKARQWSILWLSKLPAIAKGTDNSFGDQLRTVGLSEQSGIYGDVQQAILTSSPVELHGTERYEGMHVEIVDRLFPKEMAYYKDVFERSGYGGVDGDENDVLFKAANAVAKDKRLVRVVIERGELIFNTEQNTEPSSSQMRFLKAYAIEHGLELIHSIGMKKKHIDLMEEHIPRTIKLKELLMTEDKQDEAALDFLKKMVQSGPFRGKVFLAGGAVRDMIRGEVPKDLDVVVTDFGEQGGMKFAIWLAQQMGNYKEGSNPVLFPTFGTAKVVLTGQHNGVDLDGFDVESVFARKETYTPGSRKPQVSPGTIEDDAFRRDFTVNSMMLDLTTDKVLDITGKGRSDIKAGVIRTTSDPDEIFGQDALRMFRAIRFATKYNWQIDPKTVEGIRNNLNNLSNTSRERVRDELDKILKTGNPRRGFELLRDVGLLPHIAPEFQQAVGMTQNVHHNEDVFNHTLSVLQGTQPELVTRLMALFHDIGKVVTRSETPTGVHFYGHEDAGTEVVERVMMSLKYPRELIDAVKLGVKNHMRLKQGGDDAVHLTDKTLRKFKIDLGDNLENLLSVIHADNISHSDASAMPNQVDNIRKRLKTLNVQVKKPLLPINGQELQDIFNIKPGPLIGKILNKVTDQWYENPNMTKNDAIEIAKGVLNDHL